VKRIKGAYTDHFEFERLSKFRSIKHFISSNINKNEHGLTNDFDISLNTNKDHKTISENRKKLAETLGISPENFVMQKQVHGNIVKIVDSGHRGRGVHDYHDSLPDSDAMITDRPGICLFLFAADCVPVICFDPVKKVIGAAHSGWKGTVKKIAVKTVELMHTSFSCNFNDILIGIGPSITVDNYEVGQNVVDAVLEAFGTTEGYMRLNDKTGNYHFDLQYAVSKQLTDIGIKQNNIELSDLCTYDRQDLFFSARKNNTGRFGAGIMLTDQ
jgi:YfiH family protein